MHRCWGGSERSALNTGGGLCMGSLPHCPVALQTGESANPPGETEDAVPSSFLHRPTGHSAMSLSY